MLHVFFLEILSIGNPSKLLWSSLTLPLCFSALPCFDAVDRLTNVYGRVVILKAGPHLQLLLRYQHRDVTRNIPLEGSLASPWKESVATEIIGVGRDTTALQEAVKSIVSSASFRRARLFTTSKFAVVASRQRRPFYFRTASHTYQMISTRRGTQAQGD